MTNNMKVSLTVLTNINGKPMHYLTVENNDGVKKASTLDLKHLLIYPAW